MYMRGLTLSSVRLVLACEHRMARTYFNTYTTPQHTPERESIRDSAVHPLCVPHARLRQHLLAFWTVNLISYVVYVPVQ